MASKTKRKSNNGGVDLFVRARRNLEKGDYKQALKDARVGCRSRDATDEHRQVLQFAYVGRAQELRRQGNRDACRNIVEQMLELPVDEPAVTAAMPDLLLWLGMLDRLSPEDNPLSGDDRDRWSVKIADQGVLLPDSVPQSEPRIRQEVNAVRGALESVNRGDKATAHDQLKQIGRDSPLADWRIFVRGLAAYYEEEPEAVADVWSRLDPERVAARIARVLTVAAGHQPFDPGDTATTDLIRRLERGLPERSSFTGLNRLRDHVRSEDWKKAFQALVAVRGELKRLQPDFYDRVVRDLCRRVVRHGELDDLNRLARLVDPLPLDPRWNRARAMLLEQSDDGPDGESLRYWQRYVSDLDDVGILSERQRDLARYLVLKHLAEKHLEWADDFWNCPCGQNHDEDTVEQLGFAQTCLRMCQNLVPDRFEAYELLVESYEHEAYDDYRYEDEYDDEEQLDDSDDDDDDDDDDGEFQRRVSGHVIETYERFLSHVPDHHEALEKLTRQYLKRGDARRAMEYSRRVRRVKPIDPGTGRLTWEVHTEAARQLAVEGDFEAARQALDEAGRAAPERREEYEWLGKKAVLELKAGNASVGREFIERALETLEEPTALWLFLTLESIDHELPDEEAWLHEKRFVEAVRRRCRPATAARISELIYERTARCRECIPDSVSEAVARYLKRCTRIDWRSDALKKACEVLLRIDRRDAVKKLVRRGLKLFPDAAYFHAVEGFLLAKGVRSMPTLGQMERVRKRMRAALELGKESDRDELDEHALGLARTILAAFEHFGFHGGDDR